MAAASNNATPAITSRVRPVSALGPAATASPSKETPTMKITSPTAVAAGSPGSARRLIVFWAGSYPGVSAPPTRTTTPAKTGAHMPRTPLNRRIWER